MNRIFADGVVIFADATHPTHAVRPVGCWVPKEVPVAMEQSSGRESLGSSPRAGSKHPRRD
jgi:hypothetical protein